MAIVKRYSHGHAHGTALRSDELSTPSVVRDYLEPTQSMLDGNEYDSKSSYYKHLDDNDCYIVGNDSGIENPGPKPYKPEGVGQSVKDAIDQLESS